MLKLTTILLILGIPFMLASQASKSVLVNLVQSNNNFQYNEIFKDTWDKKNFHLLPTTDQLGLSLRKVTNNFIFQEIMLATSYRKFNDLHRDDAGRQIEGMRFEATYSDLHLRYEYGKLWDLPFLQNIKYGVSGSIDPRVSYRRYRTSNQTDFPFELWTIECSVNIIPQLEYSISNKFIVVFKLPFELFNSLNARGDLLNPNLTRDEQIVKESLYKFAFLVPNFTIGAGYFISHEARN